MEKNRCRCYGILSSFQIILLTDQHTVLVTFFASNDAFAVRSASSLTCIHLSSQLVILFENGFVPFRVLCDNYVSKHRNF